ncbi:unnamed protein product [Lathyrus sativus]|nr:unnamed protein product [Lathyrus sativus]
MSMTKRGRGRPKSTVPPSPETLTNSNTPKVVSRVTTTMSEAGKSTEKINEKVPTETLTEQTQVKPEERKLWVDVISDNRNPTKGLSMEYVAPKVINGVIEIDIEQEDIETKL